MCFTHLQLAFLCLAVLTIYFSSIVRGQENIATSTAIDSQAILRPLRLPNTTFPLHYFVHIGTNIHLEDLIYTGNVTIDIEVRKSTNEIVMHSKNLTNLSITIQELESGEFMENITYSFDSRASFLIIHPTYNYQAFEAGKKLRIQINFSAEMQSKTVGIYWLTYTDIHNRTKYLAATQFEPTSARLAFPCYDEPAFKANFTIRITHGSDYMAISNMEAQQVQKHENPDVEQTTTTFYTTPLISTYLVAFVVSDFQNISETHRNVTQRVFTPPGYKDKGHEALKTAVLTVGKLEDYFGINYPLSKLDHIALQKNYGAAMENWGLITYKEDNLINRDDGDIHKNLKDIITQNHEIVHQWFGNLVSPEWWTYAWLNEGFATYFGYIITDLIYPEYKAMDFYLTDIAERAYSFGFITVRPMTYYVEKESDIMSIFDIITYQRAACIIKMFHHAFHQKTFVNGVSSYLRKFQYTVANELDLFASIQHSVDEDTKLNNQPWSHKVQDIMLSWTHSEWIPIVSLSYNFEDNTLTIKQRSKNLYAQEHWWIPLNFATSSFPYFSNTSVQYFMPPIPEITVTASDLGIQLAPGDWLIANIQQTGFYHVVYDDENLMRIAHVLQANSTAIHALNRAAIFQDLSPFIESNELQSVEVIFELLKYLQDEDDLIPWNQVADIIEFLDKNLYNTASRDLYKQFIRSLTAPMFKKLFLPSAEQVLMTNTQMLVKQKVMNMACMADLDECLDYTRNLAHDYIFRKMSFEDLKKSNNDYYHLYDSILCLGLKYLNDNEFNDIMDILSHSEPNSMYYDDIIYSLRCTQSPTHLRQYLYLLLGANSTHNIMNDSESMMYLFYLYKANLVARPVMWRFFADNFKALCKSPYFAENFNRMAEYIPEKQRHLFVKLRRDIIMELSLTGIDGESILIPEDSNRLGKKVKMSEIFLEKFGYEIHNWLIREYTPISYAAASMGARNTGHRFSNMLRSANALLKKILKISLKPSYKRVKQILS